MCRRLEEMQQRIRRLILSIQEENRRYVLTKNELLAFLDGYSALLDLANKLMAERQCVEFLLAEYKLMNLGLKGFNGYIH